MIKTDAAWRRGNMSRSSTGEAVAATPNEALYFSSSNLTADGRYVIDEAHTGSARAVQPGTCYDFDGLNDHVKHTGRLTTGAATALSVFAWVNYGTPGSTRVIASEYESTGNHRAWQFQTSATGELRVVLSADGEFGANVKDYITTADYDDSAWHHVGFTFDAGTLLMYVDGAEVTPTKTTDGTVASIFDGTNVFALGTLNISSGPGSYFDGKMFDARVYEAVLSADDVADIYAFTEIATLPVGWFKCDDAHVTTAYNSGSGANLAKTNITAGTFNAEDSTVPWSFRNEVGYTFDSGNYVPRDETNTSQDADGSPIDFSGQVPRNALLKASMCGAFNGSADYIDYGNIYAFDNDDAFTLAIRGKTTSTSLVTYFSKTQASSPSRGYMLFANNTTVGSLEFTLRNTASSNSLKVRTNDIDINDGEEHSIVVTYDGSQDTSGIAIYVDGVSQTLNSIVNNLSATTVTTVDLNVGARESGSLFFDGLLWDFRVYESELTADDALDISNGEEIATAAALHSPISERHADFIADVSGNDNHGTANYTTEGAFWGQTQDSYHYNIRYGFEQYDDDATGLLIAEIPYKLDASKITPTITGYTKNQNNDAGNWHNNAKTKIDFTGGVAKAPWWNVLEADLAVTIPTAYTFGGSLPANMSKTEAAQKENAFTITDSV